MSLLPWRAHPAAHEELRESAHWYEAQEPGLGDRFTDEIAFGLASIRAWPEAATPYPGRHQTPAIRRKRIEGFPYGIIYFVRNNEVVVVAYAYEKRRPGYWRKRLQDL